VPQNPDAEQAQWIQEGQITSFEGPNDNRLITHCKKYKRVLNGNRGSCYWMDNLINGYVWADDPLDLAEHVTKKMKE
jgi:hypothetical protein